MKNRLTLVWLIALLLTPIVLWLLPADVFDYGSTSICPSKLFFDIECFGCGMTRAVMHFHHLEISEAVFYNTGVLIVFPGLVLVWCLWVYKALVALNYVKPFRLKKATH
jgi:hypothetical protein